MKTQTIQIVHLQNPEAHTNCIDQLPEQSKSKLNVKVIDTKNELYNSLDDCPPHMIIMDTQSSAVNSLEVCSDLKTMYPDIPCLVTGISSEEEGMLYLHCGASDYLMETNENKLVYSIERILLLQQLASEKRKVTRLNNELSQVRKESEFKDKENIASVSYASRIVGAMLPDAETFHKIIPNAFVLHRPKDIIGGDFYFASSVEDGFVIASADCTGHGVPGALISMIGYHLLNDIVNNKKITRPGEILKKLDHSIRNSLRKTEQKNALNDGMDISVCFVNTKKCVLEFAGANQSLYFLMNGRMLEFKSDKRTIGDAACECNYQYITHKIEYQKGDRFYLTSDGFYDQFGGPQNMRLMKKNFTGLLKIANDYPVNEQQQFIENKFDAWKGNEEQTDDVLVVGVEL